MRAEIKNVFLFIAFITLFSCSSHHELIGTWKANYNLWDKGTEFLKGVRSYAVGTELNLKADSTYREQTCGNITVGKWSYKEDSLILNSDTTWYRNALYYIKHDDANYDSIAGINHHWRYAYLIKGNKLIRYYKSYNINMDGTKGLERSSMTILKRDEN